jgi:hypothetical protein
MSLQRLEIAPVAIPSALRLVSRENTSAQFQYFILE